MKLLDVLTAPWAIQPEKLLEIQAIYATHLRGEKIDLAAVEQRLGRPLANEQKRYEIVDGVAIVPIEGVMAKRANMFMQVSGGVSTELVARDVRAAAADPAVHSIIELYDTPGGAADGLQLLISANNDARAGGKRVVSLASGLMASAGYWTGSATEAIYIADAITTVGSIGVVAMHKDMSQARAAAGIKVTEIVAGKYKRVASDNGPLTEEGRQTLQEQVDYFYSVFVADVAKHRGVSVEKVLADMADGRIFIGEQAIAAGLVDGVSTLDQLIVQLNRDRSAGVAQRPSATTPKGAEMPITREQLAAEAPDVLAAILAEGRAIGATAERERIQAVEGALIPGHEALIATLKFDGKTSGGDAALAVNAAERNARTRAAAELAKDAPNPVPPNASPALEAKQGDERNDQHLPVAERCKARWDASADLQREFRSLAAYTSYVQAAEKGVARIMNKQGA
jgi:signal peptide peptidase SppA